MVDINALAHGGIAEGMIAQSQRLDFWSTVGVAPRHMGSRLHVVVCNAGSKSAPSGHASDPTSPATNTTHGLKVAASSEVLLSEASSAAISSAATLWSV